MTDDDLPSARYRQLVRAIGAMLKEEHGWKAEAARMLGVSPSYVSRVAGGRPFKLGRHAIEAAVHRLPGLTREWFTSGGEVGLPERVLVARANDAIERSDPNMAPIVEHGARTEWLRVQTVAEAVLRHAERGEPIEDGEAEAMLDAVHSLRLWELTRELEGAKLRREREHALMLLALHARLIAYAVLSADDTERPATALPRGESPKPPTGGEP